MLRMSVAALLVLQACAQTAVTEYKGNSIRVQSSSYKVNQEAVSEAVRICRTQGLQAEYASTSSYQSSLTYSHLFLCLTRAKPNAGLPGATAQRSYLETSSTL